MATTFSERLFSMDYPDLVAFVSKTTHQFIKGYLQLLEEDFTPDLREATDAYLLRGGKCLRPMLLMLSAMAAGERHFEKLFSTAMLAVECYHTATLVHDDIIDHDELRRGKPTVHTLVARRIASRYPRLDASKAGDYGMATAIVAGDILFGYSAQLFGLLSANYPLGVVNSILLEQSCELHPGLLLGEQLDMELEMMDLQDVTPQMVEKMMRLKTGLLLGFAARVGAALGSRKPIDKCPLAETLGNAAEDAGVAFQIQDDILGLFGDEAQLGKPIGSDLREGKPTLLMVKAWAKATPAERRTLKKVLGNPKLTESDIAAVRAIVERTGALASCRRRANTLVKQAEKACQTVSDETVRKLLLCWLDTLVKRNH